MEDSVLNKWAVGAEVLITSHTRHYQDQQVRTLVEVRNDTDNPGYAILELDSAIHRPTTVVDNPLYAVEVALLSKNIRFEGAKDGDDLIGGHFWILHTPNIVQTIEGVELFNFGQQGILGRYVSTR